MNPAGRQVRSRMVLESVVSIGILAILFLIAVVVVLKQADYDLSRFGIERATSDLSPQKQQARQKQEMTLGDLAPPGFKPLSETEFYNPDRLYEKINGKAPLYIESGFVKLFTQRFISKQDDNLWMELFLYDMATIKNAFSVYSVQKRAGLALLPHFQFGYRTRDAAYFVHGKYYVEFIASTESAELFDAMLKVAQKIRANLAVDVDSQIPELSLFPQENLIPGSSKLYLKSAFGFERFTDTFVARYNVGRETITAFFSKRRNPQDAQNIVNEYYNFLIDNEAKDISITDETLKQAGAKALDFYGTTEIIFDVGSFVSGIHEAENQQNAEKLAVTLIRKLTNVTKARGDD